MTRIVKFDTYSRRENLGLKKPHIRQIRHTVIIIFFFQPWEGIVYMPIPFYFLFLFFL